MPTISERHATYRENAWPAMVATLAEELGVLTDSLTALEVGYAPGVPFVSRTSFVGWWVFPERNDRGEVVGLGLRSSEDGTKLQYPGGKRGLVYPLDPEWVPGAASFVPGPHNWTRVTKKRTCPLCDKPDGCLVSSEDPEDPKAVICIRERSAHQTGLGWLHKLKAEAEVGIGSPLRRSDLPVLIVEGPSDVAAALTLGLVAIGRPSNVGGLAMLAPLVRGRKIVVLGENDGGPGEQGLQSTLATLKKAGVEAAGALPPPGIKDLRDWIRSDLRRETITSLLAYLEENPYSVENTTTIEDPQAPLAIADMWLKDAHTLDGRLILRKWRNIWIRYDGSRYAEWDTALLRGDLYRWLDGRPMQKAGKDGEVKVEPYKPTRAKVNDIVDALDKSCPVAGSPPCWIGGTQGRLESRNMVCFENGYLDMTDPGRPLLFAPTPDLLTMTALPFPYDPEARCPMWHTWLEQTLGDEPTKIQLLQEWFGYCLVPDRSMEKLMMFKGRPGSGKGTAMEVMRAMIGPAQVASTTFRALGSRFAHEPLVGKLAALMPDARLSNRADAMSALEALLAVVGGDAVSVDRKNQREIPDAHLTCRFTIATNELPELPDYAQAMRRRLLVIHFAQSFEGKEDYGLKTRLVAEVQGIANWALEGLVRLRLRGRFTVPASSGAVMEEFRRITSPIVEFADECCYFAPNATVSQRELYATWKGWCRERGLGTGSRVQFAYKLVSAFPNVEKKHGEGEMRIHFAGVTVRGEASKTYAGGLA